MYYDSPKPRLLNTMSSIVDLTMQFLSKIYGMDAYVLIDIAASHCYLNSSYATRIGLNIAKSNGLVMLGNGLEVDLEGTINVHIKIQQYQFQISCLVTKLTNGFDLILGDEWLEKHKAHINYEACVLHKGNKKITIQIVITRKKVFTQDKILSLLQFNRAVKKGCQPLLVQLKKVRDDGPSGDPLMKRRKVTIDGPSGDPPMERRKVTTDGPSGDPLIERRKVKDDGSLEDPLMEELLGDPSITLTSNFNLEDSLVGPLVKEYDDIF